jgi:protein phosphatase
MIVCPHCQFENPIDHKFCQKCGTPLQPATSSIASPSAQSATPLNLVQTVNTSDVIWQAIVSCLPVHHQPLDAWQDINSSSPTPRSEEGNTPSPQIHPISTYLDAQERYQLLEPIAVLDAQTTDAEVRVLDRFPFEPSQLETLLENQLESTGAITSNVSQIHQSSNLSPQTIPAIAQTYLTLQHQLYPSLPQIHDAWEQDGHVILLLEDRARLPLLADILHDEQVWPLQIVHWFYEMTELWSALKLHRCRRSLLDPMNLRIDEDQILCLKRLHIDAHEDAVMLSDLGKVWQNVLQHSPNLQSEPILQLAQSLEMGEINTLDDVRLQLETLAEQFQLDESMMPTSDSNWLKLDVDDEKTIPMDEASLRASVNEFGMSESDLSDLDDSQQESIDDSFSMNVEDDDGEGITGDGDDVPTVVLPMQLFSLADSGRTDIGRQRDHNEDCFSIQTDVHKTESPTARTLIAKGLYILCDGMGGHEGGEVASALAVDTLKHYFAANWSNQLPTEDAIRQAITLANQKIYELNQKNACHGSGRMGTTLAMLLVHNTKVAIAHVGDSRLYQYTRKRGLEQITTDHEVGQREILRGVEPGVAYARPDAYQLTQALGPRDDSFINPDVQFFEINEDTLFTLCSDGLTDNELLEENAMSYLEPLLSSQSSLDEGVNQLVDLANEYNGHDNITVILVRVKLRPYIESLRQGG